ncbi:hypothetical protein M433DRAFT_1199 [Acidomyces richmondensis BFW]|nr:MAG: hypothetical protein FE78DRAFT_34394 [Acidomyces sp. 'richmondensis']KYG49317.1 hypothetical protein M433DRAFT_1199 [Acidomyces richmondensis BFW]
MAHQSSERACDRCRERRVKCDKRQPSCLRCEKLGKPCPGYDKKRKFVDEGVSLRRKYQTPDDRRQGGEQTSPGQDFELSAVLSESSDSRVPKADSLHGNQQDSNTKVGEAPSSGRQAETSIGATRDSGHFGVADASKTVKPLGATSLDTFTDPILFPEANFALQSIQEGVPMELWNESIFDPAWFDLDPIAYYAQNNNSCGFIPQAHIVDETDRSDLRATTELASTTPISVSGGTASFPESHLWASESQLQTSAIINDERDHEMAYLIRHFTEYIGPWMDLFDKDKHFEHLVPLKALRDALLRNAVAAVAAKQLGRVRGSKPYVCNQSQRPSTMETIDGDGIDWYYKAANYYDKAIAFSRVYLQAVSGSLSKPPSPNTQASLSLANSDDLLVAVSIFSLYESLDNVELGWVQHLAGLKSLLTAVSASQQEQYQIVPAITVGRQASFWNFARADYQAAYVHRRKTLLDTEDLSLWRENGLQVHQDGTLYDEPHKIKHDPLHCRQISQLCARTLLWIALKVTNYVARDTDQTLEERQTTFDHLNSLLDAWYGNIPETFQPCAQTKYPLKLRSHRGATLQLNEVFFSISVCAAALQLYHFARIVLLLNKPSMTIGVSRLAAYREISIPAIKHAREILGIALGRPPPAVRVDMSLSLYVAGGCLEDDDERRVVLELLKAIEKDTGCANDIKIRSLIDEWGWRQEPEEIP